MGMLLFTFAVMVMVVMMRMGMFVFLVVVLFRLVDRALVDREPDTFDFLPLGPVEVHVEFADRKLRKLPLESGWSDTEINQRANSHVAADAAEDIEIDRIHEDGEARAVQDSGGAAEQSAASALIWLAA